AEEPAERVQRQVVAQLAPRLQLLEPSREALPHLRVEGVPARPQLLVSAQHPRHVEVEADPLRVLPDVTDDRLEALLEPHRADPKLVLLREREEQIELRGEVAEDRPAREACLGLELRDGRALVSVAAERAPAALQDLAAAALPVLGGDLRHLSTLQKRTDVLFYPTVRNRTLAALVVAEVVSSTGTAMTFVALPWFVLETSHSATRMSVVLAAEILPMALFGIPSRSVVSHLGGRL